MNVPKGKRLAWAITEGCDANPICKYCIAKVNDKTKDIHPKPDKLNEIINGINRLGQWNLFINGGEPFSVPNFIDSVIPKLVSQGQNLFITSNFLTDNQDYKRFIENFDDNLIALNFSYHVNLFPDYKDFIKKMELLTKKIKTKKIIVSAVLNPKYLNEIKEFSIELKNKFDIDLYPQYLKIHVKGVRKPYKYTDEQMEIVDYFTKTKKKSFPISTENSLCWAGTKYIFLNHNGNAYRCQMYYEEQRSTPLGNISNSSFKLIEKPVKCDFKFCGCGSAQSSNIIIKNTEWYTTT